MSAVVALKSEQTTEREARINLAACYRLIAHFGMDDLIYTHISVRVPGSPGHFLINRYGMMFHEITASSLVKIDYDGTPVEPGEQPFNYAGFVIHSAIHAARPDVHCVLHTHTRAGVAVSCLKEGLLSLNQFSAPYYNRVAYHDYEGVATNLDERQRLVRDLGDKKVLVLRNHGLLTAGRTVPEAFQSMYYLEQSCRVQMDLMGSRGSINALSHEVSEHTAKQSENFEAPGERTWGALLRMLDTKDPSYRN